MNSIPASDPVRYRIPEYIAFVHAEEISEYSSITTYLADLRSAQISVLEGSASIIWGVFEDALCLPEALELIAELTEQEPEDIRSEVENFVYQLIDSELLEAA